MRSALPILYLTCSFIIYFTSAISLIYYTTKDSDDSSLDACGLERRQFPFIGFVDNWQWSDWERRVNRSSKTCIAVLVSRFHVLTNRACEISPNSRVHFISTNRSYGIEDIVALDIYGNKTWNQRYGLYLIRLEGTPPKDSEEPILVPSILIANDKRPIIKRLTLYSVDSMNSCKKTDILDNYLCRRQLPNFKNTLMCTGNHVGVDNDGERALVLYVQEIPHLVALGVVHAGHSYFVQVAPFCNKIAKITSALVTCQHLPE
ncbi:hypothetical protein QR680_014995 [Steinernema hermaphroditum]|uniref:Peptidase S1 domain-containing protein n=1 Tax=Steinernema hermaphroditum TaxID=289476 RepID=A0AA39IAS1_9BILA|nr:hypothetical protein QR680_014995 [Steinernema hermaphroditum]